jgi:Transposase DDE domain
MPQVMITTSNLLSARGFDTVLRRYLPKLLCFEVKPSYLYAKSDYIRLLVNSSVLNTYAEGMSNVSNKAGVVGVPGADIALLRFKSIDRYELQSVVSIVLEEQVDELKRRGILSRPVPIAFDWHDQMFYGEKETDMVNGTRPKDGSCYAYQYLTASILVDGRRLTVVLTPIKSMAHLLDYVKDALNRIRNMMGITVRHLVFDGGFSSLELPAYLEENGYTYVIHFTPNNATKKRLDLKDGQSATYPCDRPFKLVRVDDKETKISYLFATNMVCRPTRLLKRYKTRWGVETSYREHNVFLPRTKSKNFTVRLLYYATAVCIYNAWCIINVPRENDPADGKEGGEHVTALEVKVFVLIAFLTQQPAKGR